MNIQNFEYMCILVSLRFSNDHFSQVDLHKNYQLLQNIVKSLVLWLGHHITIPKVFRATLLSDSMVDLAFRTFNLDWLSIRHSCWFGALKCLLVLNVLLCNRSAISIKECHNFFIIISFTYFQVLPTCKLWKCDICKRLFVFFLPEWQCHSLYIHTYNICMCVCICTYKYIHIYICKIFISSILFNVLWLFSKI